VCANPGAKQARTTRRQQTRDFFVSLSLIHLSSISGGMAGYTPHVALISGAQYLRAGIPRIGSMAGYTPHVALISGAQYLRAGLLAVTLTGRDGNGLGLDQVDRKSDL
jgi:hypothetical protein